MRFNEALDTILFLTVHVCMYEHKFSLLCMQFVKSFEVTLFCFFFLILIFWTLCLTLCISIMINDHIAKRTGDEVGGWGYTVNLKLKNMYRHTLVKMKNPQRSLQTVLIKNSFKNFDFSI